MQRILLALAFSLSLGACNDESSTTITSDSSSNTANHTDTAGTGTQTTGTTDGRSMMQIMNSMMENMKSMQTTGNPDNDFAAMMKAHHLSAIEMAQVEIATGTDPQIKQMAQKMLDEQQKEVAELNTFLSGHSAHGGGDAFFKESMAIMNNMKMDMDHSGSIDKQFVQMMIPHHQTAIDMAKAYLKVDSHEEKIRTMANNIVSSQQKEINELQNWLSKNK